MKYVWMILLYPFSLLYGCLVECRNYFYRKGLYRSFASPFFSVGIGNLTVGGTGKTPHIEYFIRYFGKEHQLATLSRGYGRRTKGFLLAEASMSASDVGDEPWQFFLKFGKQVKVAVGEKRVPAANQLYRLFPQLDLLLLDDVFQHRAIKPDFLILLCDYNRPFFKDFPFPAGRLREFRQGARRADQVIVSKCPADFGKKERDQFRQQIQRYAPDVPVAFSTFRYGEPVSIFSASSWPSQWLLVTGIAQPAPLVQHLQGRQSLAAHIHYPDHHEFTLRDAEEVLQRYQALRDKDAGILLTEKDFARLNEEVKTAWKALPVFYLPITVEFLEGEALMQEKMQLAWKKREVKSD